MSTANDRDPAALLAAASVLLLAGGRGTFRRLLAQLLAMAGGHDQALRVLTQVDEAQALLGDEPGLQRTAALREHVQASAAGGDGKAG